MIEQYNNKDVLTQIYILKQGLIDEEAARIAADEELGRRIDAEEAARIAADLVLQANIDAEEAARIAADIVLQANIDAEEAARIAGDADLNTRLNQEEAARLAADYALGERITNEENARIAADNQLLTRIATEESNREAADNTLSARIDAEEAARITADDNLVAELTAQQGRLDTEIADRAAGDAALSDRIDAEEAARIAADDGKLDKAPSGTIAQRVIETNGSGGYRWVKRTETGNYPKRNTDTVNDIDSWGVGDLLFGGMTVRGGTTPEYTATIEVACKGIYSKVQVTSQVGNTTLSNLGGFGVLSFNGTSYFCDLITIAREDGFLTRYTFSYISQDLVTRGSVSVYEPSSDKFVPYTNVTRFNI